MEESQKDQKKGSYNPWSPEETKTLIDLLLDCVAAGLRDSNGLFSKFTVERRILPTMNQKHEANKTHQHYNNRMKTLKAKYQSVAELLRFSYGFGWNPNTKRFSADEEVWVDYIKAHPSNKKIRDECFEDFDDIKIIFEKNVASGKNTIGLGDATDARTHETCEKQYPNHGEEFSMNIEEGYETQSSFLCSDSRNTLKKLSLRKRQRTNDVEVPVVDKESAEVTNSEMNSLTTITHKVFNLIQEREVRQQQEAEQREIEKKKNNLWEAIKEVSNLEEHVRYDAVKVMNQLGMKDVFISMSIDERYGWIKRNVIE